MALKDQPYIPLYVMDFSTDEKLIECSASSHGVYIRLLAILHKQNVYGELKLKEKYKQTRSKPEANPKQNLSKPEANIEQKNNKYYYFSLMLDKQMPFDRETIEQGLIELHLEDVIQMNDDTISQKRMLKDGEISLKKSKSGAKGGKQNGSKKEANRKENSENEIENEIDIEYLKKKEKEFFKEVFEFKDKYPEDLLNDFFLYWSEPDQTKTTMRFEYEKTFEISRRLITWAKKSKEFCKTKSQYNYDEVVKLVTAEGVSMDQFQCIKQEGKKPYWIKKQKNE